MINLLPPEIKKRKGVKSVVYSIITIYVVIAALVLLGAAGLATYGFASKSSLVDKQSQLDNLNLQKTKNADLATKLAYIDGRTASATKFQSTNDWNLVLSAIASATPTDTALTAIKLATTGATPTVTINGTSKDRRSTILFKDKIAATKPFTDATLTDISEVDSSTGAKTFTFGLNVTLGKTN